MRLVLAVVAGAAVGALGAVILGEYPFDGWPIFLGAVLLGLFVAEVVSAVAGRPGAAVVAASMVLSAAALFWGAWISAGHDLRYLPDQGWIVIGVGAVASVLMGLWSARAGRSRLAPSETE